MVVVAECALPQTRPHDYVVICYYSQVPVNGTVHFLRIQFPVAMAKGANVTGI